MFINIAWSRRDRIRRISKAELRGFGTGFSLQGLASIPGNNMRFTAEGVPLEQSYFFKISLLSNY
jgi:hypothetical protein